MFLNHEFDLDGVKVKPRLAAVFKTQSGGIFNNPFLQFDAGAFSVPFEGASKFDFDNS